jgi:hypothetical protein
MFKNIQNTLEKVLEKHTNKDYLEYKKIQKKWKQKIEKRIQKNIKLIDFTEGTITLKAKNTAWKNEALFLQDQIKKNFQTQKTQ